MKNRRFLICLYLTLSVTSFGCAKLSFTADPPSANAIAVASPTPSPSENLEDPPPPMPPPRTPRPSPPILHNKEKKDDELIAAIKVKNTEQVKQLLEIGADPNSFSRLSETSFYYTTALGLAVDRKKIEIAQLLLEHGANVNKYEFENEYEYDFLATATNFGLAIQNEDLEMMSLLAAHNADLGLSSDSPYLGKNPKILDFLIKKGYDINARDEKGMTILTEAVYDNKLDLVKTILRYKPDLNQRTEESQFTDYKKLTPLQLAEFFGRKEIVRELKKAGARK
jgi:ankyrin repeat protein